MNNNVTTAQTNWLLEAGIIAGPFFIVVALLQAFTREGFNWVRHPASLLSLGDVGWIQIANFLVFGALLFVFSRAVAAEFPDGKASRGGPIAAIQEGDIIAFIPPVSGG